MAVVHSYNTIDFNAHLKKNISLFRKVKVRYKDHSKIRPLRYEDQLLPDELFLIFYIAPDKSDYPLNIFLFLHKKKIVVLIRSASVRRF